MTKIKLALISSALTLLPVVTLAQVGGSPPSITLSLVGLGQKIANTAWIVFTIIAVVMFVAAGVLFITAQGDAEKVKTARNAFIWGVVGVLVAIIAFTIITIVSSVL